MINTAHNRIPYINPRNIGDWFPDYLLINMFDHILSYIRYNHGIIGEFQNMTFLGIPGLVLRRGSPNNSLAFRPTVEYGLGMKLRKPHLKFCTFLKCPQYHFTVYLFLIFV